MTTTNRFIVSFDVEKRLHLLSLLAIQCYILKLKRTFNGGGGEVMVLYDNKILNCFKFCRTTYGVIQYSLRTTITSVLIFSFARY